MEMNHRIDELASFKSEFHVPSEGVYLCGNSLGLQPKSAKQVVVDDLERWATMGVEGHFVEEGKSVPWWKIEDETRGPMAEIVGAKHEEVICMNSLTVNLHLLLAAFYKPTKTRDKIVVEAGAFPSDEYVVQSWSSKIVRVEGSTEEIVEAVSRDDVALCLIGALQYYSGELFDVARIAKAARENGCVAGFDLAHAVGNVELSLHDDDVDFAAWCSYKYLNGGPGGIAGVFVHERHADSLKGLQGWWGNKRESRFDMNSNFEPSVGVARLQLSNPPTIPMLVLRQALDIHVRAGMKRIRAKSVALTGLLESLLVKEEVKILTPSDPQKRGAQLSLFFPDSCEKIFNKLREQKVFVDLRRPDVIRVAPAPLYNSFEDVYKFIDCLKIALRSES